MSLRARRARPSVRWGCSVTSELVRAMTNRIYGAFIVSLSAVALMLAANETFARSGAAVRGGSISTHSISRPSIAHSLRHHRRNNVGFFWPGDSFYDEPMADVTQPGSGDIHYTTTEDVPWDWAHRYPPAVAPSDRPYVPSCPAENVTVPGRYGQEQTVSIMRCY
jgi:hypothetical protein